MKSFSEFVTEGRTPAKTTKRYTFGQANAHSKENGGSFSKGYLLTDYTNEKDGKQYWHDPVTKQKYLKAEIDPRQRLHSYETAARSVGHPDHKTDNFKHYNYDPKASVHHIVHQGTGEIFDTMEHPRDESHIDQKTKK